jgi:DNA-binding transcriptional regulator LsrR (DeoR family)
MKHLMRRRPLRERLDQETLQRLYWEQGLTTKEIAERYGSFSSNVLVLMGKYEIPRRDRGSGRRS